MNANIKSQTGRQSGMDEDTQANAHLMSWAAVTMAPVVAFALANALFIPLAGIAMDFNNSILAELLASVNNIFLSYLIVVLVMLFLPVSVAVVLVSPALTCFIANLKCPVLTNWSRAILSGIVFLFFHAIFLIALLIFRYSTLSIKPTIYNPLACLGFLAGIMLSCSVAIFGQPGTRMSGKAA